LSHAYDAATTEALTGHILSVAPFDAQVQDTDAVAAHFPHFLLVLETG
jgi:heme/copper-type cytochrome/quinol oxidase subunit 1